MSTPSGVFETLVGSLDYPMFVVTAADGDRRAGCLVGFATQCSIDPPRILVCLSKQNHTTTVARRARSLVVHVLRASDRDLAARFGAETGDEVEKFAGVGLATAPGGAPAITTLDWFEGVVTARHDLGDHVGYVLAVDDSAGSADRSHEPQLGFAQVRDLEPGHPV